MPAEPVVEPSDEAGRAARRRIGRTGVVPIGIAGIRTRRRSPDGLEIRSIAVLTVEADDHPLVRRFRKPENESRTVAVLDPAAYDAWPQCRPSNPPAHLRQWMGELLAEADPLVRPPRAIGGRVGQPPSRDVDPETGKLF